MANTDGKKNVREILWGTDSTGARQRITAYPDGAGGYTLNPPSGSGVAIDVNILTAPTTDVNVLTAPTIDADILTLPVGAALRVASTPVTVANDDRLPASLGTPDIADMGVLAFDASATATLAVNKQYLIIATEDCYFHLTDGSEAATSSSLYLPASQYFSLATDGTRIKLYAIKKTTAGNLHYVKMS